MTYCIYSATCRFDLHAYMHTYTYTHLYTITLTHTYTNTLTQPSLPLFSPFLPYSSHHTHPHPHFLPFPLQYINTCILPSHSFSPSPHYTTHTHTHTHTDCASCVFNRAESNCKRHMKWTWRGEYSPATMGEVNVVLNSMTSVLFHF